MSRHVVLGLPLEPLSIGHLFLLADIASPFVQGGSLLLVDLSNAVFICSQPWKQSKRDSHRWWFPFFLRLWSRRCRKMNLEDEHAKFTEYWREQTDFPIAKQDKFAERDFGSTWWWRLLAIMMSDFHLSEEQVLDMPATKAAMLFAAKKEAEGKLQLWTQADDDFDSFCRKMDESAQDTDFPTQLN